MASIQRGVEAFEVAAGKALPARMTEEEFVARSDEDIRAEWIDGEMVVMSPASIVHNRLSRFLLSLLEDYVAERELGEAFGTDFSVRLPAKRRRLPDVLFVARDRSHCLRENHFEGAPNLIMEVVSDESVDRDWRVKYLEYEAAGVDEYWVIDPLYQRIEAYSLGGEPAYRAIAAIDGKIASRVVPGFFLRPEWLWQSPPPKVPAILRELLAQT